MPIRHIPFFPDLICGQALLDNYKHVLHYLGSENIENLESPVFPFWSRVLN